MRVQDAIRDSFRVDYYRCVEGWGAWQQQVRRLCTAAAMLQHQCAPVCSLGGPATVARSAPDALSACMCCPVCVCRGYLDNLCKAISEGVKVSACLTP